MNEVLRISWMEEKDLTNRLCRYNRQIKKYKEKLKNPINERTGKPLLDSTVKKYKTRLNEYKRESIELDSLLKIGQDCINLYPMFGFGKCSFDIVRNGHRSFFEGLVDIKTSLLKSTFFYNEDLINMVKFILGYKKSKQPGDMACSIIIYSFNSILDNLIDENKGPLMTSCEKSSSNLD